MRGLVAEQLAEQYLCRRGWVLVTRNWRARLGGVTGELDRIFVDGEEVVFVEIKARFSDDSAEGGDAHPLLFESITDRKMTTLHWLVDRYFSFIGYRLPFRIDLVGVTLRQPRRNHASYVYARNAL